MKIYKYYLVKPEYTISDSKFIFDCLDHPDFDLPFEEVTEEMYNNAILKYALKYFDLYSISFYGNKYRFAFCIKNNPDMINYLGFIKRMDLINE